MNVTRCGWAIVGLCLAWGSFCAAQEPQAPVGAPPGAPLAPLQPSQGQSTPQLGMPTPATTPSTLLPPASKPAPYLRREGPITMALDEKGFPLATGEPWSLFSPFDVYIRVGSAVVVGDGQMDNHIDAGILVEGGARSFGYNHDRSAAWTCEIGLDYAYNNSTSDDVVLVKGGLTQINRFGQSIQLPTITQYALLQLHRTALRATAGREWYFGMQDPNGIQYSLGVDVGGRAGWATAKLRTVAQNIQGFQQGLDQLASEFLDGHSGDQLTGVLGGVNASMLVPCCGYEWTVTARIEYRRDWFHILFDDSVESISYSLGFGVRF